MAHLRRETASRLLTLGLNPHARDMRIARNVIGNEAGALAAIETLEANPNAFADAYAVAEAVSYPVAPRAQVARDTGLRELLDEVAGPAYHTPEASAILLARHPGNTVKSIAANVGLSEVAVAAILPKAAVVSGDATTPKGSAMPGGVMLAGIGLAAVLLLSRGGRR